MASPYGGNPGAWPALSPNTTPPARGYRVISGAVWWHLIFLPWRDYLAAQAVAIMPAPTPPLLAPPGVPRVYFTDQQSLQGLQSASDFARRLGLPQQAQGECTIYGCAVIEFDVPLSPPAQLPPPYGTTRQGLTVGGAREWIVPMNIPLDSTMVVKYIDIGGTGPRYFDIPL